MLKIIVATSLLLIFNAASAAEMRRNLEDKKNWHPCQQKQCTKEELKHYRRYQILYGPVGKEQKSAPLRDRL